MSGTSRAGSGMAEGPGARRATEPKLIEPARPSTKAGTGLDEVRPQAAAPVKVVSGGDRRKWVQSRFAYGKKGLWEKWYEYPPEPQDDLPDEVRKQIRWSIVGSKTYWYVSKGSLSEIIHNKVGLPDASISTPPAVAPPVAVGIHADEVLTPTELESEDEPEARPETRPPASILDTPLVELFG